MGFTDKILNLIGFGDGDGYESEDNEIVKNAEVKPEDKGKKINFSFGDEKNDKVVKINTTAQLNLVVMQPESFEDARNIADHLKNKKPVVMNLEFVEKDISRKIVDFLSGAVYAVDGNIQKVSNGIFIITPYNVGIKGDIRDELTSKGIFPWAR